jgi:general secretion pathway protein A
MYNTYFGFKENPFNLTPDPRYLFMSPAHKETLDHLLYGINERKGFIAITGGIGTGKTTLCRELLDHLNMDIKSALIFNSFISDMELLKTINQEFGIEMPDRNGTKKEYIDALNLFLLETFKNGGNAVILIDEAQNLSQEVLEQLRMLSNLETEREKLLQIVLVGQPELKDMLESPRIRQLNERISVRYNLKPLSSREIRGYIEHRLVVAGGRGDLKFSPGALKKIYAYSQGNPRRINTLCDRSLLIAYAKEKRTVTKVMVKKATNELHGYAEGDRSITGWTWKNFVSGTIMLLFLIIAAGFGGWSIKNERFAFTRDEMKKETGGMPSKDIKPLVSRQIQEQVSLLQNDQESLSNLFLLYNSSIRNNDYNTDEPYLSLVNFDIEAEYHVMFKKPFRVLFADNESGNSGSSRYLLVREITEDGAIAVDMEGNDRQINREFILSHWGKKVSWVYPAKIKEINLLRGMNSPEVLNLQETLEKLGFQVDTTGVYDDQTIVAAMKFQEEFGLLADGIAGPRTLSLLYQMTTR